MEILKYHNDINKIAFNGFNEKEIDVLFTLMLKARDTECKKIILSYLEINSIIGEEHNRARLTSYIRGVSKKIKGIIQEVILPNGNIKIFGLFDSILIDVVNKNVEFSINKDFKYMLNDLISNFTYFDLKDLVSLKGNYAKTLFRLLKQWETTKEYDVKIEDFRKIMGIPETYEMKNIRQKVLKPCIAELEKYFNKLALRELKNGRSVESLKFTWKKKRESKKKIEHIEGIKIKKGLGEKEFLEFQEEEKENNNIKNTEILKTDHLEKEKKKISKDEYEKLYKEHLKEHGIRSSKAVRLGFDKSNINKYEIIEELEEVQEREEQETTGKKKVKFEEIGNLYNEFLKKYNSSDNPIMKKAFNDIFLSEYEIIDMED